jgi:hypothetical protein
MTLETILNGRLDVAVFVAVSGTVFAGTTIWLQLKIKTSRFRVYSFFVLCMLFVLGFVAAEAGGNAQKKELKEMLQGIAPTYAQELHLSGHARVRLDTSSDDPVYLSLIDAQKRWLKVNRKVADIYTFGKNREGEVVLMVDSETDYNQDGRYEGERESRTDIGEVYPEVDEELNRAFLGEEVFDAEPYTDRWGTWVSAYAPMKDDSGRVYAVLGVDYEAMKWLRAVLWSRAAALSHVFVLVLMLVGNMALVSLMQAKHEEELRSQAALKNVRTLEGLLPICASCKKIRDDKGYWNQIEVYVRDHSNADFSHGICPDCVRRLYPDFKIDP